MFPVRHITITPERLPDPLSDLLLPLVAGGDREAREDRKPTLDEVANLQIYQITLSGANAERCTVQCRFRGADMSLVGWFGPDGVLRLTTLLAANTPEILHPDRATLQLLTPLWVSLMTRSLNPIKGA